MQWYFHECWTEYDRKPVRANDQTVDSRWVYRSENVAPQYRASTKYISVVETNYIPMSFVY
jgi:hypothetical protein